MYTSDDYKILELNHVAFNVADVSACERFYADVLELESLPRPAFPFPGAWFRTGAQQELHLIGICAEDRGSHSGHFALLVSDLDAVDTRLGAAGVEFRGPKARPDGARQIFTADPDGNVIEFCDNLPAGTAPNRVIQP